MAQIPFLLAVKNQNPARHPAGGRAVCLGGKVGAKGREIPEAGPPVGQARGAGPSTWGRLYTGC